MRRFIVLLSAIFTTTTFCHAQKADVSFVAGASFASDATVNTGIVCVTTPCPSTIILKTGKQYFLEGTAAVRMLNFKVASLHLELPLAGIPATQIVNPSPKISSMFLTPALRIKFAPWFPISPFASVGGGWAHYTVTGATTNKGALQFGGGVDFKTGLPLLGFRAEVRDFVSGQPDFGPFVDFLPAPHTNGSRHTLLVGGGIVLRL